MGKDGDFPAQDGDSSSVHQPFIEKQQEVEETTGDGSVDMQGKPAKKASTGGVTSSLGIGAFAGLTAITTSTLSYSLAEYLTKALNFSPAAAASNVSTWVGMMYMAPLVGAYVADTLLGRFWATLVFGIICMLASVLLTLSASIAFLKPTFCTTNVLPCSPSTASFQMVFFYIALYLTAIGNGFTSTAQAFGADQYDKTDKLESVQKSSFFNWYYVSLATGSLVSGLLVVYIQDRFGFAWGFGMVGAFAAAGLLVFLLFMPRYRCLKPAGNPFMLIPQVIFATITKIYLKLPASDKELYHGEGPKISGCRTKSFRFLDRAAIPLKFVKGTKRNHWRLCTLEEVDEVKSIFRIAPIWFCSVIYGLLWTNMVSMFVEQGAMMDLQVGSIRISASSLNSLDPLNILLLTVVYDQLIRPWLAQRQKNEQGLTVLQRMVIGLIMVMLAMICAALVETRRLSLIRATGLSDFKLAVPMSVLWQIPQYTLVGASEVFYCVGHHEFFYNEISDSMRTLGSALPLLAISVGSIFSGALVTFVSTITATGDSQGWIPRNLNQGHLDWYFWLLAAISVGNLAYFLVSSQEYASKQLMNSKDPLVGDDSAESEPLNPAFSLV